MVKTVVVTLLCSFISLSGALECYDCSAVKNNDCYSPINKTTVTVTNCYEFYTKLGNQQNATYECVAYTEHHNATNQTFVGRHCLIKEQNDFCIDYREDRKLYGYIVDECFTCNEDLCNSGTNPGIMLGLLCVITFYVIQ
ncbi:uncharacterized protein LOC123003965 [Tribolium madens]|uniref:uncharacterized protein LOC123003965 n=1 Tax=Tribolium madens TaxID=41895 RepID=UPI001CF73BA3|nr:uncharacterized protein LOC123003965 [Tribolium madens]